MMLDMLDLVLEQPHYQPNSQLKGTVSSSEAVTLLLRWRAEGRCDPSAVEVARLELPQGEHTFSFHLPSEPTSYDGLLFRYLWEVVAQTTKRTKISGFRLTDTPSYDPYPQAGLRYNPFIVDDTVREGESRLDYQHGWQGVQAHLWLERGYSQAPQANGKQLVQLIGVKGAGKSSHLKHWCKQTGGSYRYYPPDWQRFSMPPLEPICYWDEADRIPKPLLYWAFSRAACKGYTVCVGTHVDLTPPARLLGLKVKTIHLHSVSAEDIRQWVALRLQAAELEQGHKLLFTQGHFESIAQAAQGSWRSVAKELHVWVAKQVAPKG